MWPGINQNQVSADKNLLMFLKSCGGHLPKVFIHVDNEAVINCLEDVLDVPDYQIVFNGAPYFHLSGGSEARIKAGHHFANTGTDMLILKLEERVLRLLVRCCHGLLQDIPLEKLVEETLPIMPEPSLMLNNNNFDKSPSVLMSDAIYSVPGHWDFSRLKMIVKSCHRRPCARSSGGSGLR